LVMVMRHSCFLPLERAHLGLYSKKIEGVS
jgi:hypothetical protein